MANLKMGVTSKQSTPNFPKSEHFLPPDRFSEKLSCFVFFKYLFWDFVLLPYYRQKLVFHDLKEFVNLRRQMSHFWSKVKKFDLVLNKLSKTF